MRSITAAIMQPYLFPYIGYFQLINAVDVFVFYDDVNFIKRGWINRNQILINGKANMFTVPLVKASQNKLINEIELAIDPNWISGFYTTINLNYRKAPYFDETFHLIQKVFSESYSSIAELAKASIMSVSEYIDINTDFLIASQLDYDRSLKGQDRILNLCEKLNAKKYINPINGKDLYSQDKFQTKGIELNFIRTSEIHYMQFEPDIFVPNLSIIDVLMFNSREKIREDLLGKFNLEKE